MNLEPRPDGPAEPGDQNVERLLERYAPDGLDPAFVEQVHERLQSEGARRRHSAAPPRVQRRRFAVALAAAALFGVITLGTQFLSPRLRPTRPDPDAGTVSLTPETRERMTPRARPAVAVATLAPGTTLRTDPGQRHRVRLIDGSLLSLNEKTIVQIDAAREITLKSGEVFVEVAPREKEESGATFLVHTPTRQVKATGTKFAVRADDKGTGVVVTQGTVQVPDVNEPLQAGQQLEPDSTKPATAPRATHTLEWTRELIAASESPLVPQSNYCGGALVALDPSGQETRLSLRKLHIDVHIEDGFARTTIDQTYFNANNWRMEGTFHFPLPPDASLSRLAMYVEGTLMEGGMVEREQGRAIYESIVRKQQDPALLEWVDGSTFKMRVFPLEGRQEKRIILSYSQRLSSLYGKLAYRFPAGHNLEVVRDWSVETRIKNGSELSWNCSSHKLRADKQGKDLVLKASANHIKVDRDLALELLSSEKPTEDVAHFSSAIHENHQYLALRYRPTLPSVRERQRRDWVFLFESSSDRDPLLGRVQVDVIKTLLENAEHIDTFAIVTAATRAETLVTPRPATPENVRDAIADLEKTHLVGALDLELALDVAKKHLQAGQNPWLVHVGAGLPKLGEMRAEVLARCVPENVRYVGVGVGKRWSRSFMKQAAERTGGYFMQINPDETVAWRAFDLLATLNTPRLLDVKVQALGIETRFLSETVMLAQGEELCAIAQLDKADKLPTGVAITGTLDGQPFRREVQLADVSPKADYLPRSWARLEIERLLAENSGHHKNAIIALSKQMYVMTPYTSLLVLENEAMYAQFKVDRGRKDHWAMYPCPPKIPVVHEPLPGQQPAPVANALGERQRPEDVLRTIVLHTMHPFAQAVRRLTTPEDWSRYHFLFLGDTSGRTLSAQPAQPDRYGLTHYWGAMPGNGRVNINGIAFSPDGRWLASNGYDNGVRLWDADSRRGFSTPTFYRFIQPHHDYDLLNTEIGLDPDTPTNYDVQRIEEFGVPGPVKLIELAGIPFVLDGWPRANNFRAPPGMSLLPISGSGGGQRATMLPPLSFEWQDRNERGERLFNFWMDYTGEDPNSRRAKLQTMTKGEAKEGFFELFDDTGSMGWIGPMRGLHATSTSAIDQWFARLGFDRVVYQRPALKGERVFVDPVQHAPGLFTMPVDVLAVLDAEATSAKPVATGRITPAARRLLDKARAAGWETLTLKTPGDTWTITCDGAGRFVWDRRLACGLREQVVCDGTRLLHLYPELGLGAERVVSRFHRQAFANWIPWLVLPAEDLARGADVETAGDNVVAIVPHQGTMSLHLVLGSDGQLTERRVVEKNSKKLLVRVAYDADGTVRYLDADGKELGKVSLDRKAANRPDLDPNLSKLVVLPLPLRTLAQVQTMLKLKGATEPKDSEEKTNLLLLAAHFGEANPAIRGLVDRFHQRGDWRQGFEWLAHSVLKTTTEGRTLTPGLSKQLHQSDFLTRLAAFDVLQRLVSVKDAPPDAETQSKLLDHVRGCRSPLLLGTLLDHVAAVTGKNPPDRTKFLGDVMETICQALEKLPEHAYTARYEWARHLLRHGDHAEARRLFADLYDRTLADGKLPLVSRPFLDAFAGDPAQCWSERVKRTTAKLLEQKRRGVVLLLAEQCHALGEKQLAEQTLEAAVRFKDGEKKQPLVLLAAVELGLRWNWQPRVEEIVQDLLKLDGWSSWSPLWRIAANLALGRDASKRGLECLEMALDLEWKQMTGVVDVQALRNDYGYLIGLYEKQIEAMRSLEQTPPRQFASRIVRAVDRWRSFDRDPQAPERAVHVLRRLGEGALAWDYQTTAIAARGDSAAPWLDAARNLRGQKLHDLADRAFRQVFSYDPSNAPIIWERLLNLREAGRHGEARQLLVQLANGNFPEQHRNVQQQARDELSDR